MKKTNLISLANITKDYNLGGLIVNVLKGITLKINDSLISFLVKKGMDPKFGARPMNRAIQDKVEQAIADKIIKGEIRPGQKVSLSPADLGGI